MAMLRVSSYRRLFEEEQWGRGNGSALMCGGQYRILTRGGAADRAWAEPDFEAARTLNREAVSRFVKERTLIAALNDRLAFLIETARCLEEENESLEAQILELEERLDRQETAVTPVAVPDRSLEDVVERLRREKDEILCHTDELKEELTVLQAQHEEVVKQRTHLHLEKEDIAVEVDTVTTECLALREQVGIYEEQLARMHEEHETEVQELVEPGGGAPVVTLKFPTPDVTPVIMDIKEYYHQLAESLQYEAKAMTAIVPRGLVLGEVAKVPGKKAADVSEVTDVDELKDLRASLQTTLIKLEQNAELIAELQRELAELERRGEELEAEIEERRAAHLDELAELECRVAELEEEQAELQAQMKEQCGDYEELLSEKMALDIEITAYRGLVEEEEERLCYL